MRLIGYILAAQCNGSIDQGDMAVTLRKVAQQSFGLKIDILTQQSKMIAVPQDVLKHLFGLLFFPDFV